MPGTLVSMRNGSRASGQSPALHLQEADALEFDFAGLDDGRGLPGDASGKKPAGDQIVELEVLAPRPHSAAQQAAYETMREAFGDDWRRA